MMIKTIIGLIFFVSIWNLAFAEESIPTTYSADAKNIIFDGKWTFTREWKESTLNSWRLDDGSEMVLRTAHDGNFIYVFIDYISDIFPDKGSDRAVVCIGDKEHNNIPSEQDYCFLVTLGNNNPMVLQGNSPLGIYGNFKKIYNADFVGVGTMSDKADRYTAIPHTSYEFKIPVELVGRYNEYSFYLSVYDFHRNVINSWPRGIELSNSFSIPSPQNWGTVYSPDKSLPEFNAPFFIMLIILSLVVYVTRFKKIHNLFLK